MLSRLCHQSLFCTFLCKVHPNKSITKAFVFSDFLKRAQSKKILRSLSFNETPCRFILPLKNKRNSFIFSCKGSQIVFDTPNEVKETLSVYSQVLMHCFLNLFMIIIESHKTGGEAAGLATNTVLFIYPFTEILNLPFLLCFTLPPSLNLILRSGGASTASGVKKWYFRRSGEETSVSLLGSGTLCTDLEC